MSKIIVIVLDIHRKLTIFIKKDSSSFRTNFMKHYQQMLPCLLVSPKSRQAPAPVI